MESQFKIELASRQTPPIVTKLAEGFSQGVLTLLEAVHAIQADDEFSYLPREVLEDFSYSRLPREHVYGFISFYTNFRLEPPSKVERLRKSVTCYVKGFKKIAQTLNDENYGQSEGKMSVSGVSCLEKLKAAS